MKLLPSIYFLFLHVLVRESDGLNCITCTSYPGPGNEIPDPSCLDDYVREPGHSKHCDESLVNATTEISSFDRSKEFACMKWKVKIEGVRFIRRQCAEVNEKKADYCDIRDDDSDYTAHCYCFGDNCNGAYSAAPIGILIVIPLIAQLL